MSHARAREQLHVMLRGEVRLKCSDGSLRPKYKQSAQQSHVRQTVGCDVSQTHVVLVDVRLDGRRILHWHAGTEPFAIDKA